MARARSRWLPVLPLFLAGLVLLAWYLAPRTNTARGTDERPPPAPPEHSPPLVPAPARAELEPSASPPAPAELPAEHSELRGRVRDADGTPLAGARVQAWRPEFRGFDLRMPRMEFLPEDVASVECDARGEFRIALADGERVDLEARGSGLCPAFAADRGAGDFVELVLLEGLRVQGRLTRARDGAPVVRALVRAVGGAPSSVEPSVSVSADDGTYVLRVASADARLRVEPREEQSTLLLPLSFDAEGLCVLDVALEDGVRVEGRVTERDTGHPLFQARVHEGRLGLRHATTDARGEYALPGFGNPDVAELHATAPGFGVARGVLGTPVDGRMRVDFELARSRSARGRVVDEAGQALEGARVLALGYADTNEDWRWAYSGPDGSFTLVDLAPELRHALMLAARGRATQVYDFPGDELARAEVDLGTLTLLAKRALRGRVRDENGAGLAAVTVSLEGWNADRFALGGLEAEPAGANYVAFRERQSDAAGRFAFEDLAPGAYQLSARVRGRPAPPAQALQVAGEDLEAELVLAAGGRIGGRVVDERGQALAAIQVRLSAEELRDPAGSFDGLSTRSAADGAFEFVGLPAGSYALELFPTRYGPEDLRAPLLATSVPHVATNDAPLRVELVRGLTLEGVLTGAHGAALGDHVVEAVDATGAVAWSAYTDAEGRFAMPVPRGSTWTLRVLAPGRGEPLLSVPGVAAGTLDVRLELPERAQPPGDRR